MYILQNEYTLLFFLLITNCLLITLGSLKTLPGFFKKTLIQSCLYYLSVLNSKSRLRIVTYLAVDKSYAKGNTRTIKWWCALFLKARSGCPGHASKHQIAWSTWRLWIFLWTDVCGIWPLFFTFCMLWLSFWSFYKGKQKNQGCWLLREKSHCYSNAILFIHHEMFTLYLSFSSGVM